MEKESGEKQISRAWLLRSIHVIRLSLYLSPIKKNKARKTIKNLTKSPLLIGKSLLIRMRQTLTENIIVCLQFLIDCARIGHTF